jgi:uncharacterized membrane protein
VLYAGALGLTLITHLLTLLVMIAQIIFVVAGERFRLTLTVKSTAAAQFVVLLLFAPWSLSIVEEAQHRAWIPWAATDVGFSGWLRMAVGSYARPFYDIDVGIRDLEFIDQAPVLFVLAVVLVSAVLLVRRAPAPARSFVLLLGLVCSMPWITADLIFGGWRSVLIRYQFPVALAMHLCVAFAIAQLLTRGERRWRRIGAGTAALLVVFGVSSCFIHGRSDVWWNKGAATETLAATRHIERCPAPLVVSSVSDGHSMGTLLSFAHASSDHTRFLLVAEPEMPVIPDDFEDVFVWGVTEAMLDRFTDQGWLVLEVGIPELNRLSRPSTSGVSGSSPAS